MLFCLGDEEWYDSSKLYIFINKGSKIGTAAGRYCSKMKEFVNVMESRIKEYIRPDHLNSYRLRKESATHATSGTTVPPPLTSVFLRGEWSMGVVQDIYWKFCQIGDQYLGRVMSCLDPNSTNFDALPPHFTQGLENPTISKAFDLCFKNIIRAINENDMNNFTGF